MKIKRIIFALLVNLFFIGLVAAEHPLPSDLIDANTSMMEGIGDWAYTVTNGVFWVILLLGFCIVLFSATVKYGAGRAFGYASVVGGLGSVLLLSIGWVTWTIASMFFIASAIGVAIALKSR